MPVLKSHRYFSGIYAGKLHIPRNPELSHQLAWPFTCGLMIRENSIPSDAHLLQMAIAALWMKVDDGPCQVTRTPAAPAALISVSWAAMTPASCDEYRVTRCVLPSPNHAMRSNISL